MIKVLKNIRINYGSLAKQFCQNKTQPTNQNDQSVNQESQDTQENIIPIHLRPYDPVKYQKMSSKIKYASGYAFLDVEPFPRQRIMKLCYMIMDKVKKEIPEEAMYRVYTEEKIKYIMKLTDEIDNVVQLEQELGFETVELCIQGLVNELTLVDKMKEAEPWKDKPHEDDDDHFKYLKFPRDDLKFKRYDKEDREPAKFIDKQ